MLTIASHSPLNISAAVRSSDEVPRLDLETRF